MQKLFPLTALVAAVSSAPLLAEEAPADKVWSGEVNLNYAQSAGNTNSTNFSGKSKAVREGESWRNTFKLEGNNEKAENDNGEQERTAESYFASAKSDYKVTDKSFLFGLLEYTVDRFSGYEYEASATFGYGRQLIENEHHNLKADIGPGYRRSKVEDSNDVQEEGVVRVGALYVWTIDKGTVFDEDFSSEYGQDKTVTKSVSRLKVRINGSLWGTASYEIKYTSDVPDGVKNSDRKTMLGLSYSF